MRFNRHKIVLSKLPSMFTLDFCICLIAGHTLFRDWWSAENSLRLKWFTRCYDLLEV